MKYLLTRAVAILLLGTGIAWVACDNVGGTRTRGAPTVAQDSVAQEAHPDAWKRDALLHLAKAMVSQRGARVSDEDKERVIAILRQRGLDPEAEKLLREAMANHLSVEEPGDSEEVLRFKRATLDAIRGRLDELREEKAAGVLGAQPQASTLFLRGGTPLLAAGLFMQGCTSISGHCRAVAFEMAEYSYWAEYFGCLFGFDGWIFGWHHCDDLASNAWHTIYDLFYDQCMSDHGC